MEEFFPFTENSPTLEDGPKEWTIWLMTAAAALLIGFLLFDGWMRLPIHNLHLRAVKVVDGPHKGREGKITSQCWIGSLYNRRPYVNVAATEEEIRQEYGEGYGKDIVTLIDEMKEGYGPRHWIKVWLSETEFTDDPYPY